MSYLYNVDPDLWVFYRATLFTTSDGCFQRDKLPLATIHSNRGFHIEGMDSRQ